MKKSKKSEFCDWVCALFEAVIILFLINKFLCSVYYVPSGSAEPHLLVGDRVLGNKLAYYFDTIKRNDYVIFDNPLFSYDQLSWVNYLWQKHVGIGLAPLGLQAGPPTMVKRVIAVPGDSIEGRIEKGKAVIYLNGKRLDEPYCNRYPLVKVRKQVGFFSSKKLGPVTIPNFLQKKFLKNYYSFDPKKLCTNQPWYHLYDDELVRNKKTGALRIRKKALLTCVDNNGKKKLLDKFGPIIVPPGKYWVMGDNRLNSEDSRWWGLLDEKLIRGRMSFVIYSIDTQEALWIFELIKHPVDFWGKKVRWARFFSSIIK